MSETVIQVENLWKEYRLGIINHHTLTRDLQSWWARVCGKEDPNSQIGSGLSQITSHQLHPENRFCALQNVSFEVKQGDLVGIIGRNGAGKSTLLKILSQVTAPTKGEVRFRGRISSLLEVGTGFHPELTGRENIFLNGAILGMSKCDIRLKLDEIIAFAEVDTFIDTPVKRYSSGMYVRLAFAVAAHLEPEILIVDEVLAVGDAGFQQKCLGKLGEAAGEGRTVLFVSHNMQAVRSLCSRGILLEGGTIVADTTATDAVAQYLSRLQTVAQLGKVSSGNQGGVPDEFELTSVDILDEHNESTQIIRSGSLFRVRLHYRVLNEKRSFRIGLSIYSADHIKIATVITNFNGEHSFRGECGKRYSIAVALTNILSCGSYFMNIHVKNSHGICVGIIENIALTVIMPPDLLRSPREQGLVMIPATWERPIEA